MFMFRQHYLIDEFFIPILGSGIFVSPTGKEFQNVIPALNIHLII